MKTLFDICNVEFQIARICNPFVGYNPFKELLVRVFNELLSGLKIRFILGSTFGNVEQLKHQLSCDFLGDNCFINK